MIRPIETRYKGYRFRSRLEARWAVFFDALGIKYEYEPEGFELPGGIRYLPDFRVVTPYSTNWYEVKPEGSTEESKMPLLTKTFELEPGSDWWFHKNQPLQTGVTLEGDPYHLLFERSYWSVCPRCGHIDSHGEAGQYDCWPCDLTTPSRGDPEQGLLCEVTPWKGSVMITDPSELTKYTNRIRAAAKTARSARFEHGENGGTPQPTRHRFQFGTKLR